jgi:hypothetical protein
MRFGLFGSAQADGSELGAGIGQGFHDYNRFVTDSGLGVSRTSDYVKAPPHGIEEFLTHPKGL